MDEMYKRLLKFTRDGVYRYTIREGRILFANRGFIAILDLPYTPEEITGKLLREVLVYTEKEGTVRESLENHREIHGFEYHFRTLSGIDKWVIHDSFVVKDPHLGEDVVEAIVKDITERKIRERENIRLAAELERRVKERTAQLEATVKELEAFTYSVSHDLRTPLNLMSGYAGIISDEYGSLLPPEGKQHLQVILNNARHLQELIDDLLSFSRLSGAPLRKENVITGVLVKEALMELEDLQRGRTVIIAFHDLPPCEADPHLLKQIFINLLSNSLKFSRGKADALIEVGAMAGTLPPVYFVKDNGAGFDIRYHEAVFDVFKRLPNARDVEGTGIGLAVVKRLVNRHGGKIWVESEPQKGTTFFFTLEEGSGEITTGLVHSESIAG
ncbi:MAG: ATP-binding protein [Candidatus Eremiobacteraeota bacterium]|nr:ATP-binding protein [Candidatus Eremiobacteraeota bacterium]